jgi:hypothetical protein
LQGAAMVPLRPGRPPPSRPGRALADILGQTDAMARPGAVYEIVNPSTAKS